MTCYIACVSLQIYLRKTAKTTWNCFNPITFLYGGVNFLSCVQSINQTPRMAALRAFPGSSA